MKKNKKIWVLTEAYETEALYAEMSEETLDEIAPKILFALEDELDSEAPTSLEETKQILREEVLEDEEHRGEYNVFWLGLRSLNTLEDGTVLHDDPGFEVKKGRVVYEAAIRMSMGCDMAYALEPIGYFTQKLNIPEFEDVEWVERIIR